MPGATGPEGRAWPKPLWLQIVLVLALAASAQIAGLVFAYVTRCKPGQGNDFCGAGSLAGVLFGFVAAVVVLVAGLVVVFLRRRKRIGGGGGGAGRVVAVICGAIVLVPCGWMMALGWTRNHTNFGLWLGIGLGLVLIVAAFLRQREG